MSDTDLSASTYPYNYQFRIILIGNSTVGKSSLLHYFSEGKFAEISDPTVGVDFYTRIIQIDDHIKIKLQLWDTAGQEKFRSITRSYYRNSVGVIIAYDIQSRDTFLNIDKWLTEAKDNVGGPNPEQCVFQLVGHKADMNEKREVEFEEGNCFAKYHNMKFVETSAVTGQNVNECFSMIAREIYKRMENGDLPLVDNWDGIKHVNPIGYDAISLCEEDEKAEKSSCGC
uniref:Ras-related protein Rab-10 n=1 Tax=Rhabditophanes sp. KR3021 TaxID=114890 RepID=A0AC35U7W9_9BILA